MCSRRCRSLALVEIDTAAGTKDTRTTAVPQNPLGTPCENDRGLCDIGRSPPPVDRGRLGAGAANSRRGERKVCYVPMLRRDPTTSNEDKLAQCAVPNDVEATIAMIKQDQENEGGSIQQQQYSSNVAKRARR